MKTLEGLSIQIMEKLVGSWEVALSSCRNRLSEEEEVLSFLLYPAEASLPILLALSL